MRVVTLGNPDQAAERGAIEFGLTVPGARTFVPTGVGHLAPGEKPSLVEVGIIAGLVLGTLYYVYRRV